MAVLLYDHKMVILECLKPDDPHYFIFCIFICSFIIVAYDGVQDEFAILLGGLERLFAIHLSLHQTLRQQAVGQDGSKNLVF